MDSSFAGIEIGKRSLFAHNRALTTVGHNLSNASTEGYSRQRVEFTSSDPLYRPDLTRAETPGQIGQGVDIASVTRVKDELLEGRIVANGSNETYWQTRNKYVKQMEQVYNEPTELSLRGRMDQFWNSWQELANYPEQTAAREVVIEKGNSLAEGVRLRYQQLNQIRGVLNDEIAVQVAKVNDITTQIAALNVEIVKVKAEGDNPNDLMDKRDKLVNDLSGLINITVDQRDPDEFSIHTEGYHIVQGSIHRSFDLAGDPANEGYTKITWADLKDDAHFTGGSIGALVELRDKDVRQEIQGLDTFAVSFIDLVNGVHRESYGINGQTGKDFFVQYPFVNNAQGNFDRNGDGKVDHSYIYRMNGGNTLDPQQQVGLRGRMTLPGAAGDVTVDYYPTDTVEDVVNRINHAGADVVARLDRNKRLELKATPGGSLTQPDFVIRKVEDSGQFLVGYADLLRQSGAAGAFDFARPDAITALRAENTGYAVAPVVHPSGWMAVNEEIRRDPLSIAASLGSPAKPGDVGDGRAALEIADLRQKTVLVGSSPTFDDYFADRVAYVGIKGQEAQIATKTQELIMKNLRDMRESYSGVNMDEELANMIKFQHGYNAAAKFVTTIDEMLDTVINRLGV
jgi:flagellar hook-associated protein 1 FlgK